MSDRLTDADGTRLVRVARLSLEAHFSLHPAPGEADVFEGGEARGPLTEKRGSFVTWKRAGRLRGCIGYTTGLGPLWRDVSDLAVGAAIRDSRFRAVTIDELPELEVSVSVLTPPAPIEPDEVEVGRHGLILSLGQRRGLLLPQVPIEWGWDRETFLRHTCRKAGLPDDAWQREEAELEGFEGQVFYEQTESGS